MSPNTFTQKHRAVAILLAALGLLGGLETWHTTAADTSVTPGQPWVVPPRAARKENPVPADSKSIAQGKELFTVGCVPCHGPTGRGDGPAAPSLLPLKPGNLTNPKLWEQSDGT